MASASSTPAHAASSIIASVVSNVGRFAIIISVVACPSLGFQLCHQTGSQPGWDQSILEDELDGPALALLDCLLERLLAQGQEAVDGCLGGQDWTQQALPPACALRSSCS